MTKPKGLQIGDVVVPVGVESVGPHRGIVVNYGLNVGAAMLIDRAVTEGLLRVYWFRSDSLAWEDPADLIRVSEQRTPPPRRRSTH